jgi:hypothetical protein
MEMEMTIVRRVPLVLAGLLLAGTAACTTTPGTTPGQTPTPTPIPPCPVGSWRSTGVTTAATGVPVTVGGGSAVLVTIGNDGKVKADFSGMQPVTFSAQIATAQLRGEVTYKGSTDGTLDLNAPAPTTSSTTGQPTASLPASASASASGGSAATTPTSPAPASGKSGGWHPTGTVNVAGLTITVKLTQPVATTVLNDVKVTDVTGSQTTQVAGAVDLQPLLRDGTFRCGGETTLVITTSGTAPALVWSLTRA